MKRAARAIGWWLSLPFRALWWLLNAASQAVLRLMRGLHFLLYWIVAFTGSVWATVPAALAFVYFYQEGHARGPTVADEIRPIWIILSVMIACHFVAPWLAPRPRHPKPPAPSKPKALPVVTGAGGRRDDPTEAQIVGRLDPKLQSLLDPTSD